MHDRAKDKLQPTHPTTRYCLPQVCLPQSDSNLPILSFRTHNPKSPQITLPVSHLGIVWILALSTTSVVYRARVEDRLLRKKFGKEWEDYADHVGFLPPRLKKPR